MLSHEQWLRMLLYRPTLREPHSYSGFFHQGQGKQKEEQLMCQWSWGIHALSTQQEQTQTIVTEKACRVKQESRRQGGLRGSRIVNFHKASQEEAKAQGWYTEAVWSQVQPDAKSNWRGEHLGSFSKINKDG